MGEWIYVVALNWIVLNQTASPWLLAVINACRLAPSLFLSVPAGMLADRYDPKRLSFQNNIINAILMIAIGMALAAKAPIAWIAALVLGQAVITAMEAPIRNTFMNSLFEGRQLRAAIAHSASLMNLGRILGPAIAGVLLAHFGGLVSFILAAACTAAFSFVIATLAGEESLSSERSSERPGAGAPLWKVLKEHSEIRNIMLLTVPMMFFGFPYTAMLSVLTETMLKLGPEELGALTAVSAAGALLASTMLGLKPELSTWKHTLRYAVGFAFSLCLLGAVTGVVSAGVVLFLVGYLGQAYRSCTRMHLHEVVPKAVAGKVIGLSLMDRGMIPLGGLALGALTEFASARVSFTAMGIGCLLSVAYFLPAWRRRLPRVLLSLGLIGTLVVSIIGCAPKTTEEKNSRLSTSASPALDSDWSERSISHAWGTTAIKHKPQRIVALDLPFFDALTSLGQPVVGYAGTTEKTLPVYLAEEVKALGPEPEFVGERKQPNLEVILALKPDLILASPDRHALIKGQLEQIAPVIALTDASLSDIKAITEALAQATGREAQAEVIKQRLDEAMKTARESLSASPKVLVSGSFEDEFSTWTKSSFIGTLLEGVGARYIFDGAPTPSEGKGEVAKLTVESLSELNPEYLFVYGDPSRWQGHPIYSKLQAYQNGHISLVDRDLWARSRGPLAALAILDEYQKFVNQTSGAAGNKS